MKYKIKITTYNDGEKRYEAYVRKYFFFWEDLTPESLFHSREAALAEIDKDYGDRGKSIEFEYINKP